MGVREEQERRLMETTAWARKIRASLQTLLETHGHVHFRPSSGGVAMVGLHAKWPQRGKSGITNVERLASDFTALYAAHCQDIEQGRETGEKALQSALIREAYANARLMTSLNEASKPTNEPVELLFVTDEIPLPIEGGKTVCDILALRRDGGRSTPVLIELKDARMLTRLAEQVDGYSRLMNEHAGLFADLYGALLGEDIRFDGPTEKWIVWPQAGEGRDPRESELATRGIRVVEYGLKDGAYTFRVGNRATG